MGRTWHHLCNEPWSNFLSVPWDLRPHPSPPGPVYRGSVRRLGPVLFVSSPYTKGTPVCVSGRGVVRFRSSESFLPMEHGFVPLGVRTFLPRGPFTESHWEVSPVSSPFFRIPVVVVTRLLRRVKWRVRTLFNVTLVFAFLRGTVYSTIFGCHS